MVKVVAIRHRGRISIKNLVTKKNKKHERKTLPICKSGRTTESLAGRKEKGHMMISDFELTCEIFFLAVKHVKRQQPQSPLRPPGPGQRDNGAQDAS